jgi:metal-responsive CopG/Arc/MetJ family transcriptional regulator
MSCLHVLPALPALPHARMDGYTIGMKTAVSVPDEVFRAAERHARRAHKSRSQLYSEALAEYLARHTPAEVTEAMNQVIDKMKKTTDPLVSAAARRVLEKSEW